MAGFGIDTSRITPAGAGKTLLFGRGSRTPAGSPPQVRGKHGVYVLAFGGHGITPAGAGKTKTASRMSQQLRDHPRRCGENNVHSSADTCRMGSPPQVRGKLICVMPCSTVDRITPAGAGKTASSLRRCSPPQDHPRRCGENQRMHFMRERRIGSPPQVRGKLNHRANCNL